MGNYLYDDYEAKMKVSTDIINDWNFFTKLKKNFVSPKKIFKFVEIIFISNKSPPYHTKFLQIFFNNLNILEREEYFPIVEELYDDLSKGLTFHESYNNFNVKLCDIKSKNPDRSIFNYGLVKPKKLVLEHFFLYVNYHRTKFEEIIKPQINNLVKRIEIFPENVDKDEKIKKLQYEEEGTNGKMNVTYIGEMKNNEMDGEGILIKKLKSTGETIFTYIGQFQNNKKNGLGLIRNKEGNQFEGEFLNDKFHGKIAFYKEEEIEYAEFKNGIQDGRKISLNKNGDIITTVFKDGKPAHTFSIYIKEKECFFTGKRGEDEGYNGVLYEENEGDVKVGTFNSKFVLTGEGYNYVNYSGLYCTFDNGDIVPSLCYRILEDGNLFKGYCDEKGQMNGVNVLWLMYTNDNSKGDLFIGTFSHGEILGYGEYYWGHGDFEKKVNPVGWGVRYFIDDNCYMEGIIEKSGFAKGPGYLTYNGKRYEGVFQLNEQRCLFISNDNKCLGYRLTNDARLNEATVKQFRNVENI